ncbi:CMRF35-like molecule 5 [Carassius carassius]|uniref:CMRF35-like molecule 5 n=1 Tax=Carassius carassius TaxID=217509 RepID=UPI00286851DB|nr:CMRF35-like molecule 5 [Carassius carassius]
MKMKTFHVLWIGIFLSGFRDSATDGTEIHGFFGKVATITCSHSWTSSNIKYFCRDPCKDSKDILVKSGQSPTGRYRLKDSGNTFTVVISDLQESDSGIYWCGVDRFGYDSFKKVKLTLSKDPRESITTSTEPYKYIQTSTDSHTVTPAAHSESTSVTARKTTSYSSPDDITLSPSITASVNTTVYILYAVGGLLLAVIMFAVGLVTVHQYRKKNKTSESFTLPNQSKDNKNEGVYENALPWTKSTQVKPINMTMTRQVQKSQEDAVYGNSNELYGNL